MENAAFRIDEMYVLYIVYRSFLGFDFETVSFYIAYFILPNVQIVTILGVLLVLGAATSHAFKLFAKRQALVNKTSRRKEMSGSVAMGELGAADEL